MCPQNFGNLILWLFVYLAEVAAEISYLIDLVLALYCAGAQMNQRYQKPR
jgi:hypothetical protein